MKGAHKSGNIDILKILFFSNFAIKEKAYCICKMT